MTFEQSLDYLSSLLQFGIKLGLERFEALLERAGSPHKQFRSVHVAGTNGKGSTTAMSASILREAGFKTGGYYSPYVFDVRERILLNGVPISKEAFARWVTFLKPLIETLDREGMGMTTEFELKTAVAFCFFADQKADFACIEVGMGGRLDATNVLRPDVCAITSIGLDHTEYLGDTHAKIAFEKAGIIKPGVPVVTAVDHPEAFEVIERVAKERNAPLTRVVFGEDVKGAIRVRETGNFDETELQFSDREALRVKHSRLPGRFQHANAACAVGAMWELRKRGVTVSDEAIRWGIESAWLPGRLQTIRREPLVLLDGAHNAEAAQVLAEAVRERYSSRPLTLILGMLKNHDPLGVVSALAPLASRLLVTQPPPFRALPVEALQEAARAQGYEARAFPTLSEALGFALEEAKPDEVILITGSFYLLGDFPLALADADLMPEV